MKTRCSRRVSRMAARSRSPGDGGMNGPFKTEREAQKGCRILRVAARATPHPPGGIFWRTRRVRDFGPLLDRKQPCQQIMGKARIWNTKRARPSTPPQSPIRRPQQSASLTCLQRFPQPRWRAKVDPYYASRRTETTARRET